MPKEEKDYKTNDNLIIGRNAVIELLKSGREVENVLISKGEREGSINRIVAMCKENKIVVKTVDRKKNFFFDFFTTILKTTGFFPETQYIKQISRIGK